MQEGAPSPPCGLWFRVSGSGFMSWSRGTAQGGPLIPISPVSSISRIFTPQDPKQTPMLQACAFEPLPWCSYHGLHGLRVKDFRVLQGIGHRAFWSKMCFRGSIAGSGLPFRPEP